MTSGFTPVSVLCRVSATVFLLSLRYSDYGHGKSCEENNGQVAAQRGLDRVARGGPLGALGNDVSSRVPELSGPVLYVVSSSPRVDKVCRCSVRASPPGLQLTVLCVAASRRPFSGRNGMSPPFKDLEESG